MMLPLDAARITLRNTTAWRAWATREATAARPTDLARFLIILPVRKRKGTSVVVVLLADRSASIYYPTSVELGPGGRHHPPPHHSFLVR